MSGGEPTPAEIGVDPLEHEGPAAPPRANGELVFSAPWQSRLFATTMHLRDTGRLDWERFRQGLIGHIDRRSGDPVADRARSDTNDDYWGCWQRALEDLLAEIDLVSPAELGQRSAALAARPAGHDHGEDGHHHHDH